MKTILSFIFIAFVTISGYGQAPVFQWGAVVRSNDPTSISATNTAYNVKTNAAGDVFVFGTFASRATGETGDYRFINYKRYDAQGNLSVLPSPEGAKTVATVTGNHNLFLYKLNKQGEIAWQVTSDRGYIDGNYMQFVPTVDGGVFLIMNARMVTDNEFGDSRLVRLRGSDNQTKDVKLDSYQTNTLQGVAAKIAADGKVEWAKHIIRVDDGLIDGKLATIATYFNDIIADADGNYWLAGRYMKAITFNKPGGTTETFTPHNVAGWNGDSQESRGDALLVKLNPEGELLWKLATTGIVGYQSVNSLQYSKGALYLYGNIAATPDDPASSSTFFGHTLYPSDKINAYSARLDVSAGEPSAQWVTLLKSLPQTNGKGGRIKVTNICHDGGALFLCGSLTGFIEVNGNRILANDDNSEYSNPLKGFIVRQDTASGGILGAVLDQAAGLAAEIREAAFRQNKIYAFGYTLGSSWLHVYDTSFNQTAGYNFLSSEGATAWDALFFDDRLITVNRGRNIGLMNGSILGAPAAFVSDDPPAYSAFFLSYQLDGLQGTAIGKVYPSSEAVDIIALPSAIRIAGHADVRIFSLTGTQFYAGRVNGEKEIALPAGLYVVTANGIATKTIIK
jgi:hypothetical protein